MSTRKRKDGIGRSDLDPEEASVCAKGPMLGWCFCSAASASSLETTCQAQDTLTVRAGGAHHEPKFTRGVCVCVCVLAVDAVG